MRYIVPRLESRLSREWKEIPPDERMALFASLAGSLAVPLLVALVYPISALLEISLSWCLVLGFPAWVIVRLLYRWSLSEDSFLQVLLRDLRPDPLASLVIGDSPLRRIPLVTVALVGAKVGLYYFVMDPLDYAMRMADPELWVWTNVSSVFMHVDEEHLWGNMLFLWIFGSALEPRIGRWRYLAYYFLMGSAGHALSAAFHYWLAGQDWVITLGASGAISGVMGLFVVRCYFARVGLAVPILGALGAPLPVRYRIHVNAMVLVGLYFCMDLLGARSQLEGESTDIGYLAHVGGYCFGLCIAYGTGLAREGRREVLERRASRPTDLDGLGPDREALDRVLERNPEKLSLRVSRARARSKYVPREDGREDYEAAISVLLKRDPTEAGRLFLELFRKYGTTLSPKQQLALTPALERAGELDVAARALELVAETPGMEAEDRLQALLHQARLLTALSLPEAAANVYEKLLGEYPLSRASVEAKLARCRMGSAVRPA